MLVESFETNNIFCSNQFHKFFILFLRAHLQLLRRLAAAEKGGQRVTENQKISSIDLFVNKTSEAEIRSVRKSNFIPKVKRENDKSSPRNMLKFKYNNSYAFYNDHVSMASSNSSSTINLTTRLRGVRSRRNSLIVEETGRFSTRRSSVPEESFISIAESAR